MVVVEVAIGPVGAERGSYRVEVLRSAAGEALATVELDVDALLSGRADFAKAVLRSANSARKAGENERYVREVGEALFTTLLGSAEVAGRYRASEAMARERGQELRLVLRIDEGGLAGLPWEAMYDDSLKAYVCRQHQLVRHVSVPAAAAPLPAEPPLRILGIVSSPHDQLALDVDKEQQQLVGALRGPLDNGLVQVHWLPSATWASLQEALLAGHWDVVHFVGHGDFDVRRQEGFLALEDASGRADLVEAGRLATLLRQAQPMPRLVVLNSCSGAATGATDFFSATAATLVRGGVSSVAAMQYEITDVAALEFTRGFYAAIASGRGVDSAMSSGRVAILGLSGHTLEWVTPVLYLRGDDSRLLVSSEPAGVPDRPLVPVGADWLPGPVPGFTGRKQEVGKVLNVLNPASDVAAAVVTGLPGVGKTALAVQAARAALDLGWFSGGAFFLDLHGYDETPADPEQLLDLLLRALGQPAEEIPPGVEARAGKYRAALARVSGRVLVVADNARSSAQVKPLLPGAARHRILVSSRHSLSELGARLIDLPTLGEEDAVALLEAALDRADPDDDRITASRTDSAAVARSCGYLPLALQIAAALLVMDPAKPVAELAAELAHRATRLDQLDDGERAVRAAFDLSYFQLTRNEKKMLRLLSSNPGPDTSTAAAAALAGRAEVKVRPLLEGLARAHVIERQEQRGRYRMHDLIRDYAEHLAQPAAIADGREAARDRLIDYYLGRVDEAYSFLVPGSDEPATAVFASRDDALAWLDTERPNLLAVISLAARLPGSAARFAKAFLLATLMANYFDQRRNFDDWRTTAQIAVGVARRLGNRAAEGDALNRLGLALQHARRYSESITVLEEAIAIARETGARHDEGMALNNLGSSLAGTRRFGEAIAAHEQAVAILRETGHRHTEADALNNLGGALAGALRFDQAVAAHEAAAVLYRDTGDRHREGRAMNNLGSALMLSRRYDEAITAHEAAAALYRAEGDPYYEGRARTNIGSALTSADRPKEAIAAHEQALALFRATGDLYEQGIAFGNLGVALREVDRLQDALTAHEKALAALREVGDRYNEGRALVSLSSVLSDLERFDDALALLDEATAVFAEWDDSDAQGLLLNSTARVLHKMLRFDEAITALDQSIVISRKAGNYSREAEALISLGMVYRDAGRRDESASSFQESADLYRQIGDDEGQGRALTSLGDALDDLERFDEAITALSRAADIFRERGNRGRERRALMLLASTYQHAGQFGDAIVTLDQVAAISRDDDDRRALEMLLGHFGVEMREAGYLDEAIITLGKAAAISGDLGERERESGALANLGIALLEKGRRDDAAAALKRAAAISRETGDKEGESAAMIVLEDLLAQNEKPTGPDS